MLGELLPVILLPAAALALAIRPPARVAKGRIPIGPQISQWATAMALLIGGSWIALLVAPALGPGSDLGAFGLAVVLLPLTIAVAFSLQPQHLQGWTPKPKRPTPRIAAKHPPAEEAQEEAQEEPKARDEAKPTPTPPPLPRPSGPREIRSAEVDGQAVSDAAAIARIAEKLGKRPGLVFSPMAEPAANLALERVAAHLQAHRYISTPPEDNTPDNAHMQAARAAAGPKVGHASELALDLAGGAIDSLLLLDERIALSELAVNALTRVESAVFCDEIETPVSRSCDVRIPGSATDSSRATLLESLADRLGAAPAGTSPLIGAPVAPPSKPPLSGPRRMTLGGHAPAPPAFRAPLLISPVPPDSKTKRAATALGMPSAPKLPAQDNDEGGEEE